MRSMTTHINITVGVAFVEKPSSCRMHEEIGQPGSSKPVSLDDPDGPATNRKTSAEWMKNQSP